VDAYINVRIVLYSSIQVDRYIYLRYICGGVIVAAADTTVWSGGRARAERREVA